MGNSEYYSCNIIEHGFDAQYDSINLCCRVGNGKITAKQVLIPNYKGEKINWEYFFLLKERIKNFQKAGKIIPQCQGCIFLEKKEWDNEKYITSININNWIKCNAKCVYCDRKEYSHKKEYNIYPLIKELLENNILKNPADITIAGGEPTITRDFDKTIKILIKHKITPVRVLTNAIKYNKHIQDGLKKNLINILVSTDSGTRETYKRIKLVDRHNDVWKNIKKYAKYQATDSLVKTKYIIIPSINDNRDELLAFIKQNAEAGIKISYIDIEIGSYAKICQKKEIIEFLYELYKYAKEQGNIYGVDIQPFDRIKLIESNFENS